MQIPETPQNIEQLDLMKRLDAYAKGTTTWYSDGRELGTSAKQACQLLHSNLIQLVNQMFAPLLSRVNARDMETFTMHDRNHAQKVAHLMWHVLEKKRRECLTPPEIGMMVAAAYLHDLGMALTAEERAARLDPSSDLWERLELQESQKDAIQRLRSQIADSNVSESMKMRATQKLAQAEEALLSQDTRDRHALSVRYQEVLKKLDEFHQTDRVRIPDIETCLSFDGDSFREKLVDICVSHNEDAEALAKRDEKNPQHPRFPNHYPVGSCNTDLPLVAAALRLADILDFDRERTPVVLFHYLLPSNLDSLENRSVLEWGKHLAISNWNIEPDAIVFRGRSTSHILHHAVVQFCVAISKEIEATRATIGAMQGEASWLFVLPSVVKSSIQEEGYHYVPYQFELDDERVYNLLMGGAIYDNPLVAVRELVQNSVDACKLRDSLTQLSELSQPNTINRIIVRYEEPTKECPQPRLIVTDTGTGMDALVIERYFLKVGRSYYSSSEFNWYRVQLRKRGLDFAPVSEFGIGFLSCFLLADHVEVETAMWDSVRGDTRKRTLYIDGPTRLIRLNEQSNEGVGRFKGTRITLYLCRGNWKEKRAIPPAWDEIKAYLEEICQDLPYRIILEYVSNDQMTHSHIDPRPFKVELPAYLEHLATRIAVVDKEVGLEGEVVLLNPEQTEKVESELAEKTSAIVQAEKRLGRLWRNPLGDVNSMLLRGGFNVGRVPGLSRSRFVQSAIRAKIRFTWQTNKNSRYLTPNLARNAVADSRSVSIRVARAWITYLLDHIDELPDGQITGLSSEGFRLEECLWLEAYDAFTLYRLAKLGWKSALRQSSKGSIALWEKGRKDSLILPDYTTFYGNILDLIMPKITTLQMGPEYDYYLRSPRPGWQEVLSNCRNYISNPNTWGLMIEYTGKIANLLAYAYVGSVDYLNSGFKDRLASFHDDELRLLAMVFSEFIVTRKERPARLTEDQVALFVRAQETVGDLEIGSLYGSWRIDSFKIPKVS